MTHQDKLEKLREFRQKLYEAEERLMTADSPSERWAAGQEYDLIMCFIDDLQQPDQ